MNERYKEILNTDIEKTQDLIKQKQIELAALESYLEQLQEEEEESRRI